MENKKIKIATILKLHKISVNSKENDNVYSNILELGSSDL